MASTTTFGRCLITDLNTGKCSYQLNAGKSSNSNLRSIYLPFDLNNYSIASIWSVGHC